MHKRDIKIVWLGYGSEPKNLQELVDAAGTQNAPVGALLGQPNEEIARMVLDFCKLPEDLQKEMAKKIEKLVEDYERT